MSLAEKVVNFPAGDRDAIAIGKLWSQARGSTVDSVKCLVDAGHRLTDKKASLKKQGIRWLPWLKENADALGFNSRDTAARLMKLAKKCGVNATFTETEAAQLIKIVWNNTKSKRRPKPSPMADRVRGAVEDLVAAGEPISRKKLSERYDVGERTVQLAAAEARGRQKVLAELSIDPETLAPSAKAKLEIAKRGIEAKFKTEYAERIRQIDEEVRKRVLAETKEYLAMVKEREVQADKTISLYQEWTNNRKPLFAMDQFKTILMCLHPDGERTANKLSEAFRLFNAKKYQLTGEK